MKKAHDEYIPLGSIQRSAFIPSKLVEVDGTKANAEEFSRLASRGWNDYQW